MTRSITSGGLLLRAPASSFGERVYFVSRGKRYWVRDGAWLAAHGFRWPDDVRDVDAALLRSFVNGGIAPLRTRADLGAIDAPGMLDLREIAAAELRGRGLEFGAGASPFPVPLGCRTIFADVFDADALHAAMYRGQTEDDLILPDLVTDIETLHGVADETLDYVVACHVIEHTANPVQAIQSCWRALRPGGSLVLVVPDRTRTFDRRRASTPLEHLIADFREPSAERDREHFLDFYRNAFPVPAGQTVEAYAQMRFEERFPIHYHAWEYADFEQLVDWMIRSGTVPWRAVWSHPTLPGAQNIEFYFVLTR